MKYYHFDIGGMDGVMKVANNKDDKYVAIQVLKEHFELPYADGSYIPEIHIQEMSKEKYNKFINCGDM